MCRTDARNDRDRPSVIDIRRLSDVVMQCDVNRSWARPLLCVASCPKARVTGQATILAAARSLQAIDKGVPTHDFGVNLSPATSGKSSVRQPSSASRRDLAGIDREGSRSTIKVFHSIQKDLYCPL